MSDPNINPNTGGPILLATAATWTQKFRTDNPTAIKAHFFGSNIINDILAQPDCVGIRMYNAIDDSNAATIILVGVDSNAQDITTGIVADMSAPCPQNCASNSVLSQ
jgi:hypothetical protein